MARSDVFDPPVEALLVEDDPGVRTALEISLPRRGIRVTSTRGVEEAKGLVAQAPQFDVIVADAMLTDGLGTDLLDHFRSLRPGMPGVLITGYAVDAVRQMTDIPPDVPVVEKPISPLALCDAIAMVLKRN